MLEVIKHLLNLQERDRQILKIRAELEGFEVQRNVLHTKASGAQASLEQIRLKFKQIETERKKLELEVEGKKQLIERYSLQQFQTKKNEEYRALTHEIDQCRGAVVKFEDQELELMEQADQVHKDMAAATREVKEIQAMVDSKLAELAERESNLKQQLDRLSSDRSHLVANVEETHRNRYERLLKQRGDKILVGIDHGVCGGCHMKLPPQVLITCQSDEEIVSCPNCGRILFYTSDMDLIASD